MTATGKNARAIRTTLVVGAKHGAYLRNARPMPRNLAA
jgi:hypothetical protein